MILKHLIGETWAFENFLKLKNHLKPKIKNDLLAPDPSQWFWKWPFSLYVEGPMWPLPVFLNALHNTESSAYMFSIQINNKPKANISGYSLHHQSSI